MDPFKLGHKENVETQPFCTDIDEATSKLEKVTKDLLLSHLSD